MSMKTTSEMAFEHLRDKTIMPTLLSAAQLERLDVNVRRKNFFSAKVYQGEFLSRAQQLTSEIADGKLDRATARALLKSELARLDYEASPKDKGTIKDLRSDRRLELILDTNVDMARGYGAWMEGQSAAALEIFPAQELIRVGGLPAAPRDWRARWLAAGGKLHQGRMIAHKLDPIWSRISRFGNPYPPFDYQSGMRLRAVRADAAENVKAPEMGADAAEAKVYGSAQFGGRGLSPEMLEVLARVFADEIDIDGSGLITYLGSGLATLHEKAISQKQLIQASREAFDHLEVIAGSVGRGKAAAEVYYGAPEKDGLRQLYFAQASAVLVGRKQLFHDTFTQDEAEFLSAAFREAWSVKYPMLRLHYEAGHFFLWRDDLLSITPTELLAMSQNEATNGLLLGYGVASLDMLAPTVMIFDEEGRVWGGFKNGNDDWEKYAVERARDFSYATGKQFTYSRQ